MYFVLQSGWRTTCFQTTVCVYYLANESGVSSTSSQYVVCVLKLHFTSPYLECSQEKYTETISLLERAVSIRMEKLGENHPDTVSSQNNLEIVRKKVREQFGRLVGKRHAQPIS